MLDIGFYHFHSKIISFSISPLTYNGEVSWLTWPLVTRVKNPRWTKCYSSGAYYVPKVSSSCGQCRGLDSATKLRQFLAVQRFTYDVIGQWPDLTWKCDWCQKVWLESRVSYAKFQLSIYNAFWAVPEKPSGGVAPTPLGRGGLR